MRFYRESLIGGLRDQTVATTVNLKIRRYFESSDLALVFQELYMQYLRAEVDDDFDEKEHFLFPIEVNAELLCLSPNGLLKILAKFGSDTHRLILKRKKTREGTWVKINWNKFKRIINKDSSNTFEGLSKKYKIKKQEEMEALESTPEVDDIYELWSKTSANVSKPKKLNDDVRLLIAKAIDKHGAETIEEGVKNLEAATTCPSILEWYSHKWSLKKFLSQSNGLPNWVDDEWEASAMNPGNRPKDKSGPQEMNPKDLVHDEDVIEDAVKACDDIIEYIEDHNDKDINKTTILAVGEFLNQYETAANDVFDEIDREVGVFDEDKWGKIAISDANNAEKHCLKPTTLIKHFKKYLELKVLTKDRIKNRIPINASDFNWRTHHYAFFNYYERSGVSQEGLEHIKFKLDKIIKESKDDK